MAINRYCLSLVMLSGIVVLALAGPSGAASGAERTGTPRGYPVVLAAGSDGGVWFGGARPGAGVGGVGAVERVEQVGYITPAGAFRDFPFPEALAGYWPEYFARGPGGQEWFLAYREGTAAQARGYTGKFETAPVPLLVRVSTTGEMSIHHLAVPQGSEVRGLAYGHGGALWMTEVRRVNGHRVGAILRMDASGAIVVFRTGLARGALPYNITSGPEHAMWFTDTTGRIGRIGRAGVIREFPVGHRIERSWPLEGPPRQIIAGPDRSVWFVLDYHQLARVTASGRVQIINPPLAYPHALPPPERSELITGLAVGPEGHVWFSRQSGEVGQLTPNGRIVAISDRLPSAFGIAFGRAGVAWVGERPRERGYAQKTPAAVARFSPTTGLTQLPQPPRCRVPDVVGDSPNHAAEAIRDAGCELARIIRPAGSHSNRLIIVSQSAPRGALVSYKTPLWLRLGKLPAPPKSCRAPRYSRVVATSRHVRVWLDLTQETDGADPNTIRPRRYYACVPPSGKPHLLFRDEEELDIAALRTLHAAGHFVAFTVLYASHYNHYSQTLEVFDASRGRSTFHRSMYEASGELQDRRFASFAVNAYGQVAWVESATNTTSISSETLYVHDASGTRQLEAGATITGLSFDGDVLHWDSSGQPHSETLGR